MGPGRATMAAEVPVKSPLPSPGRCDGAYNRVAAVEVVRSGWIRLYLETEGIGYVASEDLDVKEKNKGSSQVSGLGNSTCGAVY